jgi:hypothetical protein
MAAGTPAELAARTIPIASPTLVRVWAETMSAPAAASASIRAAW